MHAEDNGPVEFRINYGEGLTLTEKLLKSIGQQSFLRFWSHANPHVGPTQELCDLLVVCGDIVILFSDKSADFNFKIETATAWERWYRTAIKESVNQLNGASRHIDPLDSPIYKDQACQVSLGVPIPPPDRLQLYRVAVVSLSSEVNEEQSPVPFLRLDSGIRGGQHLEGSATPFTVGDVLPDKEFVHVMEFAGLWAVLSDLDTITDFAKYLDARGVFIRNTKANVADSEWCMLARYLFSFNDDGTPLALDREVPGDTHLTDSEWQSDEASEAFRLRREANRQSYLWDGLIENQAGLVESQGFSYSTFTEIPDAERVVRYMALETRLTRRLLSRAWKEACSINVPGQPANTRTVPHGDTDGTTYVFFNLRHPELMEYEEYRQMRREMLKCLMLASLVDEPESQIIIGVASEYGQVPDSYDLAHFNVSEDANHETLQADALDSWNWKRQHFHDPIVSITDERDIPYAI